MDCDKDGKCDFTDDMRKNISRILNIDLNQVSVKAKTNEKMEFQLEQKDFSKDFIKVLNFLRSKNEHKSKKAEQKCQTSVQGY